MAFSWINQILLIPTYILHGFVLTRFINFRRLRLFWVCWIVTQIITYYFIQHSGLWIKFACIIFVWVMIPFVLSDEKPSKKLLACGLSFIVMMVAEALVSLLWILATGSENTLNGAQENMISYILMKILHLLTLTLLFYGMSFIWKRLINTTTGDTLFLFAAFPLTQAILLYWVVFIGSFLVYDHSIYIWALLLAVFCIMADLSLFFVLRRINEKQIADERAAIIQKQIEEQLAHYNRMAENIRDAACFRHDLSNQLQTVYALIERGEQRTARLHLDAMAENLIHNEKEIVV